MSQLTNTSTEIPADVEAEFAQALDQYIKAWSEDVESNLTSAANERLVRADYKPECPRVRAHGLNIVIENEKGSERSGVDPNGKSWKVAMPADYGELHGFKGADGDYVDCYVGEVESAEVHVVDQRNIFGAGNEFDEHKCFVNFPSANVARETYLAGYTDGRGAERIAGMTTMNVDEFKAWLRDKAKTKKPTLQAVNEKLIADLAHGVV